MIKIKSFYANIKDKVYGSEKGLKIGSDLFIVLLIVLVGTASFGLGKLSAIEKKKLPIAVLKTQETLLKGIIGDSNIENLSLGETKSISSIATSSKGIVFASKSGKRYYYPWCSGAERVKESNKVWFLTVEDAKKAGLTPAVNCTGLK